MPATAASNSVTRFEHLRQQDLRVANVAYRLAASSRKLCQDALKPQLGFVLHILESHVPTSHKAVASSHGPGRYTGVIAVDEGSPAAKAGLVAGDRLISVNSKDLAAGDSASAGGSIWAQDQRAKTLVLDEITKGEVTLHVSNAGGVRDVRFGADLGCPSDVKLVSSKEVNAWADGSRVVVTDAIIAQCGTDDELALVIAHGLAHNILRHRQRLALAGVPDNRLLPISAAGSARIRETEEEADRFAVGMARAAGYDLGRAASFLKRLLAANGLSGRAAATHPASDRRLALLSAAIAEADLQSKRTAF